MIISDIIKDTTPLNLHEERERFFAEDNYNPQLRYIRSFTDEELAAWGKPIPRFADHAFSFVKQYRADLATQPQGPDVSQQDIITAVESFNSLHQISPPVEVIFSRDLVAKCKVANRKIYFHVPVRYTQAKFDDLCRHELDTHLLRIINHETQPWKEVRIPELQIRRTEEGLANLHTFLLRENKVVMKSYVTYTAVSLAQQYSFREVFQRLREIGLSTDLSWRLALRTKRGLTDTAQPGGLTRDICYLEGVVMVWDWIINQRHNPRDCYLGRLSLADIPKYRPAAQLAHIQYPEFMNDMSRYLQQISEIGEANHFQSLL